MVSHVIFGTNSSYRMELPTVLTEHFSLRALPKGAFLKDPNLISGGR